MNDIPLLNLPDYNPNALFDWLLQKFGLKYDADLARLLQVPPPVISNIRHMKLAVGATLLLRMHEVSNLSIEALRGLMGDRRDSFGFCRQ